MIFFFALISCQQDCFSTQQLCVVRVRHLRVFRGQPGVPGLTTTGFDRFMRLIVSSKITNATHLYRQLGSMWPRFSLSQECDWKRKWAGINIKLKNDTFGNVGSTVVPFVWLNEWVNGKSLKENRWKLLSCEILEYLRDETGSKVKWAR